LRDVPDEAMLRTIELTDLEGNPLTQLYFGQRFRISFTCEVLKEMPDAHFEISLSSLDGTHVTYSTTIDGGAAPLRLGKGIHQISAELDVTLLPREYTIDLGVHHQDGRTSDFVQRTLDFTVLRVAEIGEDHYRWNRTRGLVRAMAKWQLREIA
jgi:hypothetical protein